MIIKLPIIEDNKIILSSFRLEKKNDYFILSLYDNLSEINFIKIICFNKVNGIQNFNLFLPLKITIFNDLIFTYNFFYILTISDFSAKDDFFSEINKQIQHKYNYSFLNFNNLKNNVSYIWKNINNEYNLIIQQNNFLNFDSYLKHLWELTNLLVNASVFLLYNFPLFTNKNIKEYQNKYVILKKIISIANIIKTIKYSIFLSNEYNILEHLKLQKNQKIDNISGIEIDKKYFIKINEKKYLLIKIDNIINSIIISNNIELDFYKYELYHYIPNINLSIQNIFLLLLNNKDTYSNVLNKIDNTFEHVHNCKILLYFFDKPIKSNLYFLLNKTDEIDMQLLENNNYDQTFFKFIVKKYTKLTDILSIIKILFNNYNFPIKFNKFEIEFIFDNILYISLFNLKDLININNRQSNENKFYLINELSNIIPIKVKLLYFNILKMFYQIINTSDEYIYNPKFFYDNLYKNFIKIFFFENSITYELLSNMINSVTLNNIKNDFRNNFLIIEIANSLSWSNILNKTLYLNILIKNKRVFYQDKLNKIIFPENYDNKIKSIILNPYEMFNYFNYENEFINWLLLFDYKINDIYFNPISLSTDDIKDLGKLIYYLYNIIDQDFKDNYYKLFVNHSQKNSKIILFNKRINLKIRDYFNIKTNLNCGILAKHITTVSNNNSLIYYDPKNEMLFIKNQLKLITKKYLKYKRKYREIKNNLNNTENLINSLIPLDL